MGAHGGAEAARCGADAATTRALTPPVGSLAGSSLAQLAAQQLQILASDWQAGPMLHSASQGNRGARPPGLSTVSQGRWQKAHAAARPADRLRVRPLAAPLLHVSEQHGKDPSRSRSGGLPWAHRSGGRTRRSALRRAPCYRGVGRREAAVHLAGATLTASYLVYALEQTVAPAVQRAPPPVPTSSGAGWQFSGTVRPAAFLGRRCFLGDRSRAAEHEQRSTHTHNH